MREIPEEFKIDAKSFNQKQLCQKYHVSTKTCADWLKEIGEHHSRGESVRKQVAKYDDEDHLIKVYPSLMDAAREIHVEGKDAKSISPSICNCCKGKTKHAYGYVWKYYYGPPIGSDAVRKRYIHSRLVKYCKGRALGWCKQLVDACGGELTYHQIYDMRNAGKFEMAQWEILNKAIDQVAGVDFQ